MSLDPFPASRMSRISVGLASSCLSLKHARFAVVNLRGARVRVYTKPCRSSSAYGRAEEVNNVTTRGSAIDFGPSLQRGRRLLPQTSQQNLNTPQETRWARTKPELEFIPQVVRAFADNDEIVEQREDAFGETNLLNAKELAEKLVKEDGSVKKFVKGAELDRESFTRVYDVAALRVPADECGVYVSRLKGHLLNWPRVKNVPRVEGDDGDAALKSLLWDDNQTLDTPESLVESVRSAVYLEESEFQNGGTGTVKKKRKYPNLRKLTRGVESDLIEAIKPRRTAQFQSKWDDAAVKVEVVEECREALNHGRNFSNSLSFCNGISRFCYISLVELSVFVMLFMGLFVIFCEDYEPREATRLLLLDERYKDKPTDELPQAVQVPTLLSLSR